MGLKAGARNDQVLLRLLLEAILIGVGVLGSAIGLGLRLGWARSSCVLFADSGASVVVPYDWVGHIRLAVAPSSAPRPLPL